LEEEKDHDHDHGNDSEEKEKEEDFRENIIDEAFNKERKEGEGIYENETSIN